MSGISLHVRRELQITNDTLEERLQKKSEKLEPHITQLKNWDRSRVVTPGQICGYETKGGLGISSFCIQDCVQLYHSNEESQGLFFQGKKVTAVSVTEKIKTETKRSDEKKGTYIQYDKERIDQEDKDFEVQAKNYRNYATYDGGHRIDHQFSAQESHTVEENYNPQHSYYNRHIRNHLINSQRCDDFIEIPLYTPNPPLIGVKGKEHSHEIPIGFIFVQIKEKKIRNVYYFPNAIDYKGLSVNIPKGKGKTETLASYFCLDPSLHVLLQPAIIHRDDTSKQTKREREFLEVVDEIANGMYFTECSEAMQLISQLSYHVLHNEDVDPFDCISEDYREAIENEPLTSAFNALGRFLIDYGMKNTLKTETLFITARLIICNVIISLMRASLSERAFDYLASMGDNFHDTLDELTDIASTLNEQELRFLINTTLKLSFPELQAFISEIPPELYGLDTMPDYFQKSMELLRLYVFNFKDEEPTKDICVNLNDTLEQVAFTLDTMDGQFFQEHLKEYSETLEELQKISRKGLVQGEVSFQEFQETPKLVVQRKGPNW